MKSQEIQDLLKKYQDGTISSEEREKLLAATHCDGVMRSAEAESKTIRAHRRKVVSCVAAALVLIGGAGILLRPSQVPDDTPMMARQSTNSTTVTQSNTTQNEDTAPVESYCPAAEPMAAAQPKTETKTSQPETAKKAQVTVVPDTAPMVNPQSFPETQVLCNLECDADSVLYDVIKFLHA